MSLRVSVRNRIGGTGGCHGDTTGVVVLDDGNGRLIEVVGGAQGGVGVNVVVVAHGLAVQLLGLCNAGGGRRVDVQGGALVRVLAVAQGLAALEAQAGVRGPEVGVLVLQELGCGPGSHGGVVGGGVGECASGQAAALLQREATVLSGLNRALVVGRVHHNCDGIVVLCSCANHGGAANVDLLNDGVLIRTRSHGLDEGVQVHDDQIEGLDVQLAEGVDVLLLAAVSQNTGVDARVQGLHTALEALGKAGHLGHLGDGNACGRNGRRGRTGGHQGHAGLVQTAGEILQAGLVVDRNEGAAQGHAIELNKRHKYSDTLHRARHMRRHGWWMDVSPPRWAGCAGGVYPRRRAGHGVPPLGRWGATVRLYGRGIGACAPPAV